MAPDDDKAWDMLLSRLEGIENGVSLGNDKLDEHREQTRAEHLEVKDALKDLERDHKSTSSALSDHLEDHGKVKGKPPAPDVAPTWMWIKHHPWRAIAALACCLGIAFPTLGSWIFANAPSWLRILGAS